MTHRAITRAAMAVCVTSQIGFTANATEPKSASNTASLAAPTITLSESPAAAKSPDLRIMTATGVCSIEITREKLARCKETGLQYSGKIIQCDGLAGDARTKCDAANATARKSTQQFSR